MLVVAEEGDESLKDVNQRAGALALENLVELFDHLLGDLLGKDGKVLLLLVGVGALLVTELRNLGLDLLIKLLDPLQESSLLLLALILLHEPLFLHLIDFFRAVVDSLVGISASHIVLGLEFDTLEHLLLPERALLGDVIDELLLALSLEDAPDLVEVCAQKRTKASATRRCTQVQLQILPPLIESCCASNEQFYSRSNQR